MGLNIILLISCLLMCGLHTLLLHAVVENGASLSYGEKQRHPFDTKHEECPTGEKRRCFSRVTITSVMDDFPRSKTKEKIVNKQNSSLDWKFVSAKLQDTAHLSEKLFDLTRKKKLMAFTKGPHGSAATMVSGEFFLFVGFVCLLILEANYSIKSADDKSPNEDKRLSFFSSESFSEYDKFKMLPVIKKVIYGTILNPVNDEANADHCYNWIQLPVDILKRHLKSFASYSLSVLECNRLATFRNLPQEQLPQTMSVLRLANGGFSYRGMDDLVQCEVCFNEVRIHLFMDGDLMLDPKDAKFHRYNCGTQTIDSNNGINNAQDTKYPSSLIKDVSKNNPSIDSFESHSCNTETDTTGGLGKSITSELLIPSVDAASGFDNSGNILNDTNTSKNQDVSSLSTLIGEAVALPELKIQGAACDDGYVSDDPNFIDGKLFKPEHAIEHDQKRLEDIRGPIRSLECTKNPGHFAYFLLASLIPDQLPSKMRNKDFLEFLKCFGALTVRIVVKTTSQKRHKSDPSMKSPNKVRWGTGWVSLDDSTLRGSVQATSEKGRWRTVKKYVKTLVKKSSDRIYITTNKHIVFDDSEAENTQVEFFFDEPSRKNVKVIKCVAMKHSGQAGDNEVVLECKTSDQEFINSLQSIIQRLPELVEKIPRKIKELMRKKPCILHHPHGREKYISYGDAVVVKYLIEKCKEGNCQMTKVNNQTLAGDIRKVLLYAADTCQGTSGAPVLTFQRGPLDASDQPSYRLDVWMHNGEDKNSKLGGTSMKELAPEDLHPELYQQNDTPEEDSDEDEASPGNQVVSAPSIKVAAPPANQDYASCDNRLESFAPAKQPLIHSAKYFARAGFYYGGYDDCVKCFCCNIGLKSWKPGDNVYEQHQKHRPGCRYLLSQMKLGEPYPADQWAENAVEIEQGADDAKPLNLLQKENEKLKSALVCKVCAKEPVRDLFLPCGELYACTGCSKLLTHCPSCKKQIMATVTTYLT